jgi:hypothetical protein
VEDDDQRRRQLVPQVTDKPRQRLDAPGRRAYDDDAIADLSSLRDLRRSYASLRLPADF